MYSRKAEQFKVGDSVRLVNPQMFNALTVQLGDIQFLQKGDTGVITDVTDEGYTVRFTLSTAYKLKDGNLEKLD